jgi:hypothetical protein
VRSQVVVWASWYWRVEMVTRLSWNDHSGSWNFPLDVFLQEEEH